MTDELSAYKVIAEIEGLAKEEYVRYEGDRVISTNTVEGYYSIFKRGMKGVYQHCSEKHLALFPPRDFPTDSYSAGSDQDWYFSCCFSQRKPGEAHEQ